MIDHRYINSPKRLTDLALFKWPQRGLKLGQDSDLMTRNVRVLLFVDRSSFYSFMPCLTYLLTYVKNVSYYIDELLKLRV